MNGFIITKGNLGVKSLARFFSVGSLEDAKKAVVLSANYLRNYVI